MTNVQVLSQPRVDTLALGWALSLTLVVIFVLCGLAVFAFPDARFSHAWLDLFTNAPITSVRAWVEGILANVILSWLAAVLFAPTYNRLARR